MCLNMELFFNPRIANPIPNLKSRKILIFVKNNHHPKRVICFSKHLLHNMLPLPVAFYFVLILIENVYNNNIMTSIAPVSLNNIETQWRYGSSSTRVNPQSSLSYWIYFVKHLNLFIATAIHNFKWLKNIWICEMVIYNIMSLLHRFEP